MIIDSSRYPSMYITTQFQSFFMKYISSTLSLLPLIDNEEDFFVLRKKLLTQPSIPQVLVIKSVASIDTMINNKIMEDDGKIKRKEKDYKFNRQIIIHCTHEARFEGLQRHIHEIHDDFFKNTDYGDIRLIVGHRNNPNLEFELARKRPHSSILKNLTPTKKQKPNELPPTA
ncbi:unnamed protein product [Rotaria sp. Silwood2]|nr:unnamed protein product [Rotaria sp. Silwood2]CAF2942351.1 unnamed protein product [Rotaria sp. Silwood2]CAF4050313.1 unnamed protein product [Rotaria sp. Silwood2]CAF4194444.1 unnamed protein product [Rotaria sp. Silwood2]